MNVPDKKLIQELIGKGDLESALKMLAERSIEGIQLLSMHNSLRKEQRMGILSADESFRMSNKITHSALALLDYLPDIEDGNMSVNHSKNVISGSTVGGDFHFGDSYSSIMVSTPKNANNPNARSKIYVLYHRKDLHAAENIKKHLAASGFHNIIDHDASKLGEKLSTFSKHDLRSPEFIILLVSRHSLRAGWAGLENYTDIVSNALVHPHCIVLALDRTYEQRNFISDFSGKIDDELDALYQEPQQTDAIANKIFILNNQRNHLARIVQRLRQIEAIDYSKPDSGAAIDQVIHFMEAKMSKPKMANRP